MGKPVSDKRHPFPFGIIAHAVWLYFRFPLSLPLVEEMLLERYVRVSYETVFRWALKFGPAYARRLRRKTPSRRDVWRLNSSPHRHGGMGKPRPTSPLESVRRPNWPPCA
jgi:putative transposase